MTRDDGGISRLKRRMAAVPAVAKDAVQPALNRNAKAIVGTMRKLAPDDPATGEPDLVTSIEVTTAGQRSPSYSQPGGSMVVPENAIAITVGNEEVRYPHLVEYGTQHAPAQPFFWPAVRLHNKKAKASIKRAVGKAVRDNWGKS